MKKLMLVVNPHAGRSAYRNNFGEALNLLHSGGYNTTIFFTDKRGDAIDLTARHAPSFDAIACIGGDGTLSEVMSGLMQAGLPLAEYSRLLFRQAGAQRGHRIVKAILMQGHHVDVALHQNEIGKLGLLGQIQAEEVFALVEDQGLRRI